MILKEYILRNSLCFRERAFKEGLVGMKRANKDIRKKRYREDEMRQR